MVPSPNVGRFGIEEVPVGDPRLKLFVQVPWELYRGDPYWRPPLRGEFLGSRFLGLTGLLTPRHPYHRHAQVTHFVARSGKKLLGRVSAAINLRFNHHHGDNLGFFGFFECVEDYRVAQALLDQARAWLAPRGCRAMRGPGGYSTATHESHQGVLIQGFTTPPTVELTHNPPFYGEFLERYGLRKVKDYVAYRISPETGINEQLARLASAVRTRRGIETRPLNMKELPAEVERIVAIYNEAWAENWGFLPLTADDAQGLVASLRAVADPELIRFGYAKGELAAVFGAIPDPNVVLGPKWNAVLDHDYVRAMRLVLGRRKIRKVRLMFFGIRPPYRKLGVDAVLFQEILEIGWKRGYREGEASMLLEDNELILRPAQTFEGELYKVWRIYEMPLP